MLKVIRYSIRKGILKALIKIAINLIIIYSIGQVIDTILNYDFGAILYALIPESFSDMFYFLLLNGSIFIGIYVLILLVYIVLERVFITATLYRIINSILLLLFITNILSPAILYWSELEQEITSFDFYYFNADFIYLIKYILIHLFVNILLYNVLRNLHRNLLKDVLDYPTLQKGVTIRLLEVANVKRERIEERKKIRQQLEQKYLDDLKNLNSKR
jgi:signal transduction histidine kinase